MPDTSPDLPRDVHRDLLFGVLALNGGMIDRTHFADACSAWVSEKEISFADWLVQHGWLTAEDKAHIEYLLERAVGKCGGSPQSALATLADDPIRESLTRLPDPVVQRTVTMLPEPSGHVLLSTVSYQPELRERYTLTHLHATGGIGQVWLARDLDLGREVALKELKPERATNPGIWARFLQEAQITGQLEHPGIVPIYELSRRSVQLRPFYTMRFVRGRTLTEASQAYHHKRQMGREEPLEQQNLLTAFVAVCHAVAYAHSRGVIHRDLKGQNVVLGDFGEVILLDWGLAKVVSQTKEVANAESVHIPDQGVHQDTLVGDVLGTPAYMSPEQAGGEIDRVDQRSDIYGLGAILYEILTGAPPYVGSDTAEVLRRVCTQDPPKPRQVVATVAPSLEAICVHAMARRPEERYRSATDLARDVQRFLADEPVSVYPDPWTARVSRWTRRHRTGALASLAGVVAAGVCLLVSTVLLAAANERERVAKHSAEQNRELAEQQRDKARAHFQLARNAVDQFHTQVSQSPELKAHGLELLRQKLLQGAVDFYQRFVHEEAADPELKAEQGRAYLRLGDLCSLLVLHGKAEEAYGQALATFQRLTERQPDDERWQQEMAAGRHRMASLYQAMGKVDRALPMYREALAVRQRLSQEHPNTRPYARDLAQSFHSVALLYSEQGQFPQSETANESARAILQELTIAHPAEPEYLQALATSYNNIGLVFHETSKLAPAEQAWVKSRDLRRRLVSEHPDVPTYQQDLGRSLHNLANLYNEMDRNDLSEAAFGEAITIRQRLTDSHPQVPEYRLDLAASADNLGFLLSDTRRPEAAEETHQRALLLRRQLADSYPQVPDYQYELAKSYNNLGEVYYETARDDQAGEVWKLSLPIKQRLTQQHPDNVAYVASLGGTYSNLGNLAREARRWREAHEWYERAAGALENALAKESQHSDARAFMVDMQSGLAIAWALEGSENQARQSLSKLEGLAKESDTRTVRYVRARVLGYLRDYAPAAGTAVDLASDKVLSGRNLYELAVVCALAASAAKTDAKLAAPERIRLSDQYATRAVDILQKARAANFFHFAGARQRLQTEEALASLRSRDDYRKFVAELTK
jgi:serine/threonine-protein kinase